MTRIAKWFLLLTLIGPLHMAEQMVMGIEEFYMIQGKVGTYYSWFSAANADTATVGLITIVWTLVSLFMYAILLGGKARLAVIGLFGVFGVQELHHVVEAIQKGAYDPGLVTCVPFAVIGGYLLAAVWREHRELRPGAAVAGEPAAARG